jgi:hypothetical protein
MCGQSENAEAYERRYSTKFGRDGWSGLSRGYLRDDEPGSGAQQDSDMAIWRQGSPEIRETGELLGRDQLGIVIVAPSEGSAGFVRAESVMCMMSVLVTAPSPTSSSDFPLF